MSGARGWVERLRRWSLGGAQGGGGTPSATPLLTDRWAREYIASPLEVYVQTMKARHPLGVTRDCVAVFERALGSLPAPGSPLHDLMLVWDSIEDTFVQTLLVRAAVQIEQLTPLARVAYDYNAR